MAISYSAKPTKSTQSDDNLSSYRREARFTTWAQKICVRVALTELRRRRWRDVSLEDLMPDDDMSDFTPAVFTDPKPAPDEVTTTQMMMTTLGIAGALVAVLIYFTWQETGQSSALDPASIADPALGPASAPVEIVELGDPELARQLDELDDLYLRVDRRVHRVDYERDPLVIPAPVG